MAALARVRVPTGIRKGDVVEIRTLITHAMESGQRRDEAGRLVPRRILNRFTCSYNGRAVIRCDWASAIAANPYFTFFLTADVSGTLDFTWTDDDGTVERHSEAITVG